MHIDGTPFRKLGNQVKYSGKQIFLKVKTAIRLLPFNWQLTKDLCDTTRFSRILIIDGKNIKVAGFDTRLPFIYGIDYLTHDILHGDLFLAEDTFSFTLFFQKIQELGYWPDIVVADDRAGIKQALKRVFPLCRLQLCHNHYLQNIRVDLKIKTVSTYQHFFNSLRKHIFHNGRDEYSIDQGYRHVWTEHTRGSRRLQNILLDIYRRKTELFNYLKIKHCPNSTNLIELYNSHLQSRLKSIKGFQSFESAALWLNAWMIRRRTTIFTDCDKKFKHLNKHASLEFSIKKQAQWPEQLTNLGINETNFSEKIDF